MLLKAINIGMEFERGTGGYIMKLGRCQFVDCTWTRDMAAGWTLDKIYKML